MKKVLVGLIALCFYSPSYCDSFDVDVEETINIKIDASMQYDRCYMENNTEDRIYSDHVRSRNDEQNMGEKIFKLNLQGQIHLNNKTINLKKLLRYDYHDLQTHKMELHRVVVVARAVNSRASIALNTGKAYQIYGRRKKKITIFDKGFDSQGVWNLDVRGELQIEEITLYIKNNHETNNSKNKRICEEVHSLDQSLKLEYKFSRKAGGENLNICLSGYNQIAQVEIVATSGKTKIYEVNGAFDRSRGRVKMNSLIGEISDDANNELFYSFNGDGPKLKYIEIAAEGFDKDATVEIFISPKNDILPVCTASFFGVKDIRTQEAPPLRRRVNEGLIAYAKRLTETGTCRIRKATCVVEEVILDYIGSSRAKQCGTTYRYQFQYNNTFKTSAIEVGLQQVELPCDASQDEEFEREKEKSWEYVYQSMLRYQQAGLCLGNIY
jgi:hypothetical protein